MKERNSNIELLRIICMLFIIMGHFVGQSGFLTYELTINNLAIAILSSGARIATNIFLIICVWYLCDSKFNAGKALKTYTQLYLYTFLFTTLVLLIGYEVSVKDVFRGYLPFFGRALWFASAYISLYLLSPILNNFFKLDIKKQYLFNVLSFVFVCVVSTMPDIQEGYLVDSIYFIFMYLWIGTLKHNFINTINRLSPSLYLIMGGVSI